MVNSPLIRPYFLGGWHWGGVPLGSHDHIGNKTRYLYNTSILGLRYIYILYIYMYTSLAMDTSWWTKKLATLYFSVFCPFMRPYRTPILLRGTQPYSAYCALRIFWWYEVQLAEGANRNGTENPRENRGEHGRTTVEWWFTTWGVKPSWTDKIELHDY